MIRMTRILMALFALVILFTACSEEETGSEEGATPSDNFNKDGFPIVNEPITLEMMGAKAAIQSPWEEMDVFKEMEKMTNINFDFRTIPQEEYEQTLNLTFASEDLPDLLYGANLSNEDASKYGEQGQLIPLEGLIEEHAPNLSKLMEDDIRIKKAITSPDGHIYSLPAIMDKLSFGPYPKLWINQKWLDNLGLDMPETIDELHQVLEAFKTQDPNGNGENDEIPLSSYVLNDNLDFRQIFLNAVGFTGDWVVDNKTVKYAPIESEYKVYLEYLNKIYEEQLLDQEVYSQTNEQKVAKGNKGQLGAFWDGGAHLTVGNELAEDYVIVPPLTSEVNSEKMVSMNSFIINGRFAITKENEHPAATMRWVDHFYGEEGAFLINFGVEGKTWEYIDDKQGMKFILEEGQTWGDLRTSVTPFAGVWVPMTQLHTHDVGNYKLEERDPINYHIQEETDNKLKPHAKDVYPNVHFTSEERSKMQGISTDAGSFVQEATAEFIVGERSLDEFEDYVSTLKQMGVDELIEIYQDAYDRWDEIE